MHSVYYDIPVSTNIHKSQLLRGLNPPAKLLDQTDHDMQRNRANKSGRNFGGAPLYDNRQSNDRRRSGDPGGRPINYANPFAQHLDPGFAAGQGQYRGPPVPPQSQAGQIPPPWMAAQMGWAPPPNFNGGRPPPPPVNYQQSYGAPQDYGRYQGNQQNANQQHGQSGYGQPNGRDPYRGNQGRPQNDQSFGGQRNDNRGWNGGQRDSRGGGYSRR